AAELGSLGGGGEVTAEFVTPPYLQNVKPDGITVMWEMNAATDAVIQYGPDANHGMEATATGTASGAGTTIYKGVLTGLEPGATYHYRVSAGPTTSGNGTFTTAPDGPEDFAFAVWGDSQGTNHGAYEADPYEPTKSMFRHMAAHGVDFAVGVGDLAENGASYGDVRQYYLDRAALLLGPTVPWFVAWGNHDQGSSAVIRRFNDLPSQDRPGFSPGYGSYSFDFAGCHFICIDHASRASDIANWLETDLKSEANQAARFTFLFIHVPPYCELWIDGDAGLRTSLVPLMERYGVDVCFSGHTHEYSRGYLNGVHYCITGGGSWLDTPELLVRSWEHMTVGGYHPVVGLPAPPPGHGGGLINEYVRVEVTGNTFHASMEAFEADGKAMGAYDRFSKSLELPRIVRIERTPEGLRLEWTGMSGPCQVQFSPGLAPGSWADIGEPVDSTQAETTLPLDGPAGFYRVRSAD
ncbi:MAG: metallophosphoesterase family protein, partial [Verrucomicrobiae bacterium]|nr:metallophosphoesterase family protein [Verrucomicrobiae bacterium]